MLASIAQFLDAFNQFRYIEASGGPDPDEAGAGLGKFSAALGVGMVLCTLEEYIRWFAMGRPGDDGRAMLDLFSQLAAAVNNIVPILKTGEGAGAKEATDRLQALVSLAANGLATGLGVGTLVDTIRRPEATLG